MFLIWLCSARCDTGESMASLDFAHTLTTLRPVWCIFSVSWSTAVLEGAHTRMGPPCCFTNWYTIVAEVTVLPVPGGPYRSIQYKRGMVKIPAKTFERAYLIYGLHTWIGLL